MANVAARTAGFIHTRLHGPVSCRAYGIGPAAVRLGNVTIVMSDRTSALSVATASMFFEEVAPKLGRTYQKRFGGGEPREKNDLAALVAFNGRQEIKDHDLTPAYMASDKCGEASLTVGNVRITVCDRDAAERVAKALADAYDEAVEAYARLLPLENLRESRGRQREPNRARGTIRV